MSASKGARAYDVALRFQQIVHHDNVGRAAISAAEEAEEMRYGFSMLRLA